MNLAPHEHSVRGMSRDRRTFLRESFMGSLFLLAGQLAGAPRAFADEPGPAESLTFFSPHEFRVFRQVAERIVGPRPPGAPDGDEITRRADAFLALEHPEIQEQFHLLLTLFDSAIVAFLFDLRFSSFLGMSPEAQDSYLADWMTSPLAFRRTAFQGLKRLAVSVYYTEPRSWRKIGFDGEYNVKY